MSEERVKFESKIGERSYFFDCENNSPWGEAYDAITQIRAYMLNKMVEEHNSSKDANLEQPKENNKIEQIG